MKATIGSVCSGIEAASVAWLPLGVDIKWFSEIAEFPSAVLKHHYPTIPNLGDMTTIPDRLLDGSIPSPDLICGGTPCQAFSLAGWQNGLEDQRGNLTLRFVDIVSANDSIRKQNNLPGSIVFWENVEGVLLDKTNAFGCLVSSLAGFESVLQMQKWPNAGIIHGITRNVAWRVMDARYFGLPQKRRRVYLLAGDKTFFPENVLFEEGQESILQPQTTSTMTFEKKGHSFEVFREYTDCVYSSYGTKWNGNAAAYNGSLFVVQDGRIRRLSPIECERLMGFPDNYTLIKDAKKTNRYQAIGNSWAVPVIHWIGVRLFGGDSIIHSQQWTESISVAKEILGDGSEFYNLGKHSSNPEKYKGINCSTVPSEVIPSDITDIIEPCDDETIFLSPVGCYGIIRRTKERKLTINPRLKQVLMDISSTMPLEEIEKKSRIQPRGRYSQ